MVVNIATITNYDSSIIVVQLGKWNYYYLKYFVKHSMTNCAFLRPNPKRSRFFKTIMKQMRSYQSMA